MGGASSLIKGDKTSARGSAPNEHRAGGSMPAVPVLQHQKAEGDQLSESLLLKDAGEEEPRQLQAFQPESANPGLPNGDDPLSAQTERFIPPVQKKENNTGLPNNLKAGVENLSGFAMDDVKVHYNSNKPAQLHAFAYAQGADIHIGPGQEKHLPHEAWHVAQQKQGRVQPTRQMKGMLNINDDTGLEKEADEMGSKALDVQPLPERGTMQQKQVMSVVVQRVVYPDMATMWAAVAPGINLATITGIVNQNAHLALGYNNLEANMAQMNFVQQAGRQPEAAIIPGGGGLYDINYGARAGLGAPYNNDTRFVGSILHEMMHISAALQYDTNAAPGGVAHVANMNLPAPIGPVPNDEWGMADNQMNDPLLGARVQMQTMSDNWENLRTEGNHDNATGALTDQQANVLTGKGQRIDYAEGISPMAHYETVLVDILYYLIDEGATGTRTYRYASRMMQESNVRRTNGVGAVLALAREPAPAAPGGGGCCFITTACVQYKGLDDNCEELTVLRTFRDQYLLKKSNGTKLFNTYYLYSPLILQSIRRREDEAEILARLYRIIKECVDAIKRGDNEFAYSTYCRMVLELKEEFIPEIEIAVPW
jgi:hypothetical protein